MALRKIFILTGTICLVSTTAFAGGFSSAFNNPIGTVSAKAHAHNYANLASRSGSIQTRNYAKVSHQSINHGKVLKGFAEAGNKLNIIVDGKTCNSTCKNGHVKVDQKSIAKTKIYIKGKNMLAKAYAKNYVKVNVAGKLAFENEEYAYALGRFTPLGTQMKSGAVSRNKLEAKGLVRLQTGQVVVSSGQVGK